MQALSREPEELLRATVAALSTMDVAALEQLSVEAEQMVTVRREKVDEALRLKRALGELLQSTERSLRMLRGLHDGGRRRVAEAAAWAH